MRLLESVDAADVKYCPRDLTGHVLVCCSIDQGAAVVRAPDTARQPALQRAQSQQCRPEGWHSEGAAESQQQQAFFSSAKYYHIEAMPASDAVDLQVQVVTKPTEFKTGIVALSNFGFGGMASGLDV
jgi:hypothetical protein